MEIKRPQLRQGPGAGAINIEAGGRAAEWTQRTVTIAMLYGLLKSFVEHRGGG